MKNALSIYLLLIILFISKVDAQVYFNNTYQPYLGGLSQALMPNDDIVLVGASTNKASNNQTVIINRFNKCGTLIWSKRINQKDNNLLKSHVQIDNNQNIIISGHYFKNSNLQKHSIFIMSLNPNGRINYFKVFKTDTDDILYSMDINRQNEILLYFKTNIGQAGPKSRNTIAKLTANAQIIWLKQYGFTWIWGKMTSTSDGGAVVADNRHLVKVNDKGVVQWTKEFENSFYPADIFETPNGIVVIRYQDNTKENVYVAQISHSGNLKWNSQLIPNFNEIIGNVYGIIRENGHLLILGKLSHPDLSVGKTHRTTFLEIDTADGSILKTIVQKQLHSFQQGQFTTSLAENSKQEIVAAGKEILSIVGSNFITKVNKNLERVSCHDTLLNLNFPRHNGKLNASKNTWDGKKINLPLVSPKVVLDSFEITSPFPICQFSPTFSIDIGSDTTLCPNNDLILRDTNTLFDHYQWSNGATTPTTTVDSAGLYWLKVWNDCDSTVFSDSIKISYHPLPKLELGNDTSICNYDSLMLFSQDTVAYWSTGDTAQKITVNQAGTYWAKTPTICGFIRDSITIKHLPQLQKPNLGNDTTLCYSEQIVLAVNTKANYVRWSTGEKNKKKISIDSAGSYSVTIANACDTLSDTINVSFHPKTTIKLSVSKQKAKVLDSIFFNLISPTNYNKLLWQFGNGESSNKRATFQTYRTSGLKQLKLLLTDSLSCLYDSTFNIEIKKLPFRIPNIFSPNGDGINDEFKILADGIEAMELKIFNRWGELIFQSQEAAWDGKGANGNKAPTAVYFYTLIFKQVGNTEKSISGTVELVR